MNTTREYKVQFTTPAFLGNAEQSGQWRTPPFKALLRQWWRVAWAEQNGYNNILKKMREEENHLFGSAADGKGMQSRVRLRLDSWQMGTKRSWGKTAGVTHPEVHGGMLVDSSLYLGYGPVKKSGELKQLPAIGAGESINLKLAFPQQEAVLLDRALALIGWYGSIGGRSRNGWGSFMLLGEAAETPEIPVRNWKKCFELDWPHAIGCDDNGPLVWWTKQPFHKWEELVAVLAELKIQLRTSFPFNSGKNASIPDDRHWLSYPVSSNHTVKGWSNLRLPNSLRFKAWQDTEGQLRGLIYHMPCKPPPAFNPKIQTIENVWQRVYAFLDQYDLLQRGE